MGVSKRVIGGDDHAYSVISSNDAIFAVLQVWKLFLAQLLRGHALLHLFPLHRRIWTRAPLLQALIQPVIQFILQLANRKFSTRKLGRKKPQST